MQVCIKCCVYVLCICNTLFSFFFFFFFHFCDVAEEAIREHLLQRSACDPPNMFLTSKIFSLFRESTFSSAQQHVTLQTCFSHPKYLVCSERAPSPTLSMWPCKHVSHIQNIYLIREHLFQCSVCMYVCMYVCSLFCMYVCMYVCMDKRWVYVYCVMYVCVCICIWFFLSPIVMYLKWQSFNKQFCQIWATNKILKNKSFNKHLSHFWLHASSVFFFGGKFLQLGETFFFFFFFFLVFWVGYFWLNISHGWSSPLEQDHKIGRK